LNLLWLPRAIRDRDAQIDYIAEHNLRAAIHQGDKIDRQVGQLMNHPQMGRPGRIASTRELVISGTPFIVVYRHRPRAQRIEVIRLLHGAQMYPPP
jgi:toxin ParE1/3/4